MTRDELLKQSPELAEFRSLVFTIQNQKGDKVQFDYLEGVLLLLEYDEQDPDAMTVQALAQLVTYHADINNIEETLELFLLGGEEENFLKDLQSLEFIAIAPPVINPAYIADACIDEEVWCISGELWAYQASVEQKVRALNPRLLDIYKALHQEIMRDCQTVVT